MIKELRGVEYITQEKLEKLGFEKLGGIQLEHSIELFKRGNERCLVEKHGDKYKIVNTYRADET